MTIARLEATARAVAVAACRAPAAPRPIEAAPPATAAVAASTALNAAARGRAPLAASTGSAPHHLQLLAPKLRPPRPHPALVARERLLAQLDAGLAGPLTLLSAPVGCGKTTLVRQWLAARPHLPPVGWVSLDPGDNDPVRFWRYVITACQTIQPEIGQSALAQLAMLPQPPFEQAPLEPALTTFLNELTDRVQRGILVLDDYHVITAPQIHETLSFVLEHLPAPLHVLLVMRGEPPLPLARLRAAGDLCEVQATDLRFSREETAAFLQQTVAIPLPPEALERLDAQLDGWAAGLRLLALALHGRTTPPEVEHILASFAGRHRPLQDYVVGEVLRTQPAPLQDFLLRTSGLSRLTGSLCSAVTGRDDGADLLGAAERAGLFLEPLDETGEWYRYHALFADAVQQEARRRLGDDALRAVAQTASLWYEQHSLPAEAIEAALQAGNMPRAAELIEQMSGQQPLPAMQELHTLRRWLEQIPEAVLRPHPALCLAYATALVFIALGDRSAPPAMAQLDAALQMAEQGLRAADDRPRLGAVCACRALVARQRGEAVQAVAWARQALAHLPAEDLAWRSVSVNIEGLEAHRAGQFDVARRRLLEARALCEALGNRAFMRPLLGMLSAVCVEQAELHQAAAYGRQMLAEAREMDDPDDVAHALLGLAPISYEWNELDAAQREADEAFALGEQLADEQFQVRAALLLARVEQARGQTAAAQQRLAALLARLQPHASPVRDQLYGAVLAGQAQLQLAVGDLAAVQRWASGRAPEEDAAARPRAEREREELLVARLQLAQGHVDEARGLLDRVLRAAQEGGRRRNALEAEVLLALAHAARKQGHEARQHLHAVLFAARADGFQRLFLDEGEGMSAVLRTTVPHLREQPLVTYVQGMLHAFAHERTGKGAVAPDRAASAAAAPFAWPVSEPLSRQEQRVLRLLAAGRSNPEIAQELFVSVNTVKAHVKSLYRKLNVSNRLEASEAARHLPLS